MGKSAGQLQQLVRKLLGESQECEWIEFKENNSDPERIGRYVSALANSALLNERPCGYLLYGVEDNTLEVRGTTFRPKEAKVGNEPLESWLNRLLDPKIHLVFHQFEYEGKALALIEIPAAWDKPVRFKKTAYVRVGSITTTLVDNAHLEKQMWKKLESNTFESGFAMEGLMDEEVLQQISALAYFKLMNRPVPQAQDKLLEALVGDRIIVNSDNGYAVTNMGAVLFAQNLNSFTGLSRKAIRVIVYSGNGRTETKVEQLGQYGYAIKFDGLISWIDAQLPMNEIIEGGIRKQVRMYPTIAIRELVANAMIHQDFSERGTGIMVEIFNNRIEISNPGRPLIDTDRFLDFPPKSRNESLAAMMRRMGICEERGSGIDKVVLQCELLKLPAPDFAARGNNLTATLFAHKELRNMEKEDRVRSCYLHACLKYAMHEEMTNQTVRERFSIEERNYPMASRIIRETVEAGMIKLKDPDSTSRKYARYVPYWA